MSQGVIGRMDHAQGLEYLLLLEAVEPHSGYFFNDSAQQYKPKITVFALQTHREMEWQTFHKLDGGIPMRGP